ncbi:MAG: hypothetical protein K0S78_1169 [Thermomicrobiales bacterium]|jgi:hypothetical protein|nr:hypothetical protein [Thermomicrobiales bacterium]MDF3040496.1 hypothetical protein [Thermomicrobiales bacterium]
MADRDKTIDRDTEPAAVSAEELLAAHPTEPAEGARNPGEDADDPRPPHPDEPAEGERR